LALGPRPAGGRHHVDREVRAASRYAAQAGLGAHVPDGFAALYSGDEGASKASIFGTEKLDGMLQKFGLKENEAIWPALVPKTPSYIRCFYGTGGESWRGEDLRESSSLRQCG
jgi:hypothetical protein